MDKFEFIRLTQASREAAERLDAYAALLTEWNQKFNLVAPSTISSLWSRHFFDSAQLCPMVVGNGVLADLGSGAGFPGIVLSAMGKNNVHLIESTGKKADFLRMAIEKLAIDAVVHQSRIEELKNFKADIITARALASLNELFHLASPLIKKDSLLLFLKGQKADGELTESRKYWMFDCTKTASLSDSSGSVLTIRNLNAIGKPKSRHSR